MSEIPKQAWTVLLLLACLALVPVACIAKSRATRSPLNRVHLFPDMDNQGRFKSQQGNPMFADRRAMRMPVLGTVARGSLGTSEHYDRGVVAGDYATTLPVPVTMELLERGQDRFDIYCTPCHGLSGYGDGMVSRRAERLQQGSWVPPSSFHMEPASTRPPGHIFNSITNGIRTMPAYGSQIPVDDRWAIVGYVKALQRSQASSVDDVPAELRAGLR